MAIKSVDDEDPIGPICRPLGKGGVTIMWNKNLNSHVNILQDGNERTLTVQVGDNLFIVNVYLPARGTEGAEMEFDECLSELEEITVKYGGGSTIILAGDMNASIHRDKGLKRDQHLHEFVQKLGYKTAKDYPRMPTFVHHNGSTYQIDYIFSNQPNTIEVVDIANQAPLNTPMHNAVSTKILVDIQNSRKTAENMATKRVNWDKIDKNDYSERVTKKLQSIPIDKQVDSKTLLHEITSSLKEAVEEKSVSNIKTNRKRKLVSPAVLAAYEKSKTIHWRLKNFKGTEADRGLLLQQRKTAKKELRRTQRAEKAENRHKIYRDIMTANSYDKQFFFNRLVKMQREGKVRKLSKLIVNDVHLQEDDKIREGWAVYFTNLSTAKSGLHFDQEYQQLVDRDIINLIKLAAQEKDSAIEIYIST